MSLSDVWLQRLLGKPQHRRRAHFHVLSRFIAGYGTQNYEYKDDIWLCEIEWESLRAVYDVEFSRQGAFQAMCEDCWERRNNIFFNGMKVPQ